MQDLPVDRLGPYPLLQFAAAILVIGGLAIAIWRGTKDRQKLAPEQRWFFDGPLAATMTLLRENREILRSIERHVEPLGELGRNQEKLLEVVVDKIEFAGNKIVDKLDDIKDNTSQNRARR